MYCLNDPVNLTDPTGKIALNVAMGLISAVQTYSTGLTLAAIGVEIDNDKLLAGGALIMSFTAVAYQLGASGNYGKLGAVCENPNIGIKGFSTHVVNQAITRGVKSPTILNTIKNPLTVLRQGKNYVYIGREATVVMNEAGKIITTYGKDMYDDLITSIVSAFL